MNAIKKTSTVSVNALKIAIPQVPVIVHLKEDFLKIQVCKISGPPNYLQLIFTRGAFALTRVLANKRLEFRFQKSTMMQSTIQKYFENHFFTVHHSFILPRALSYAFNKESIWIRKGKYLVTETKDELIVTF